MSRIKRTSPALVISILALIAALVVPALAQVATTALTKKEKRVVRKIAKGQANKQITRRASRLAVASARSAGNADKLDGQDASAFTPADEVHSPGRVVVDDPTPGDEGGPTSTLFNAGSFSVRTFCLQNIGGTLNDGASVVILGPDGFSASAMRSGGNDGDQPQLGSFNPFEIALVISSGGNEARSGHGVVVAPSGEVLSVSASVEVNDPAGDCVFGVTAIGP
jgi:hypothetical protein